MDALMRVMRGECIDASATSTPPNTYNVDEVVSRILTGW
jgi:hypothetical protein